MSAAWNGTFDCGCDFFDELEPLGLSGDAFMARNVELREAARDAWARLGASWLHDRRIVSWYEPWALEEFGPPPGTDHAD